MPQTTTTLLIHSTHLTENLLHHKLVDVLRILEEKGFQKSTDDSTDTEHHYRNPGNPENGKRTRITFDDQDFVMEENGVQHLEE